MSIGTFYSIAIATAVAYLFYNYAPGLIIEPQAYKPHLMNFEGSLAVNKDLEKGEIILDNVVHAPESLAYKDGIIYASLQDGRIVAIENDRILKTVANTSDDSNVPGCPLGLRFFDDYLYVADFHRGLLKVDIKTGKVAVLVSKTETIYGETLNRPNDLDIAEGVIYFSGGTTAWNGANLFFSFMERANNGRVYKYDIETGKTEVAVDSLTYPNGIQFTPDKKSILIAEFLNHRILRYFVSGPKKGQLEVFAQLPGEPDNIRPSSRGGYWVPLMSGRQASSPSLIDRLSPYPAIVKLLCKLSHALGTGLSWINHYISSSKIEDISLKLKSGEYFLTLFDLDHPILVELNAEGKIIRSLHASNLKYGLLSQGLEIDGHLYLGSFKNSHILKVKL